MGYYIFGFGIKESEILQTFNSQNREIIQKVEENEYFENYNDENYGDELTTKQALYDIIDGNQLDKKYGYAYGYALISICATFGKELPYQQEIKLGYETDYINQFLAEDFGLKDFEIEEFLFADNNLSAFPIPEIEDFPMLSIVKLEKLKELKSKLSHIIISNDKISELQDSDDEEKGYSYEHIKGVIDNIDFCIKNELDLFSACH